MRTIDDLLLAAVNINIDTEIETSFKEVASAVPDLLRAQLHEGGRGDDERIYNVHTGSDQYSYSYSQQKGKSSPIDLEDTGAFYEAIGVNYIEEKKGLDIFDDDEKSSMLQEVYGKEILELDTTSSNELAVIAGSQLIDNLSKSLSK